MIKGNYDWLKDLASRNVCAEHKSELEVACDDKLSCYYLRCGTCGPTQAITRFMSYTEEYRAGEPVPDPVLANIKKAERRKMEQRTKQVVPFELQGVPQTDLETGELLSPEQIQQLVDYAHTYGLDPARGHVCLMYGKPYIGLDGYLFHARRSGIPYNLQSRPMTTAEAKVYKVGETDHGWIAHVLFIDDGSAFTGTGIVTYEEMTKESKKKPGHLASPVVAAHPWQLAQKRAEWQALRRAFPIGEAPSPSDSPSP